MSHNELMIFSFVDQYNYTRGCRGEQGVHMRVNITESQCDKLAYILAYFNIFRIVIRTTKSQDHKLSVYLRNVFQIIFFINTHFES